jgi:hypothetical protein
MGMQESNAKRGSNGRTRTERIRRDDIKQQLVRTFRLRLPIRREAAPSSQRSARLSWPQMGTMITITATSVAA